MGWFIGMDRKQLWNGAFRKPLLKLKAKLPAEWHLAMNSIQAIGLYVFQLFLEDLLRYESQDQSFSCSVFPNN